MPEERLRRLSSGHEPIVDNDLTRKRDAHYEYYDWVDHKWRDETPSTSSGSAFYMGEG